MTYPFTLIGVDIEGAWNRPLLLNAAAVSGCECTFAQSAPERHLTLQSAANADTRSLEEELHQSSQVLVCELTRNSVGVYDLPAPRQRTAIVVGNEERGVPRSVIKRANHVISVPMACRGLSSLNVAVAAAVILYSLTHDLARRRKVRSNLRIQSVDILIAGPSDPHELGSLLRSLYSFGWRRVFLSDPHNVWFSSDPAIILQGRAAARRAKNLLVVMPAAKLNLAHYDAVITCQQFQDGPPLSRFRLPECGRLLIVFGESSAVGDFVDHSLQVMVDHAHRTVPPCFRHDGSILLSVISQQLCP
jgi:tRNA(Leu) C34 or U34 (ribose-2'-O)-methylase TrmL